MAHRAMRRLTDTNYGQEVRELVSRHPEWKPAQVYEALRQRHGLREAEARPQGFPGTRAVQLLIQRGRKTDESADWTFLVGDPEDAALVIPALRAFDRSAKSRRRAPTVAEAEVIARIRRARPEWTSWQHIRMMATLAATYPDQVGHVEDWLTYEPWVDDGARLIGALADGVVEPWWFWPPEWFEAARRLKEDSEWRDTPDGQALIKRTERTVSDGL